MVYLLGSPIVKRFFSPTLSKATCFCTTVYFAAFIIAYLLAFGDKKIWDLQENAIVSPTFTIQDGFYFEASGTLLRPTNPITFQAFSQALGDIDTTSIKADYVSKH